MPIFLAGGLLTTSLLQIIIVVVANNLCSPKSKNSKKPWLVCNFTHNINIRSLLESIQFHLFFLEYIEIRKC
jgi:hypothetical protein